MAEPITSDLLDLMPDTIIAHSNTGDGARDGKGNVIDDNAPAPITIQGRYSGSMRRLGRGANGKELVSTLRFTTGSVNGLSVEGFRFMLDDRYNVGGSADTPIEPLMVKPVSDENGPHHEVIFFP